MIVGDQDRGRLGRPHGAADVDGKLVAQSAIECGERFVEQQQSGVRRERTRQRDALRLPARQLVDRTPFKAGQLYEFEHLRNAFGDL